MYKAALFDLDGTLTDSRIYRPRPLSRNREALLELNPDYAFESPREFLAWLELETRILKPEV